MCVVPVTIASEKRQQHFHSLNLNQRSFSQVIYKIVHVRFDPVRQIGIYAFCLCLFLVFFFFLFIAITR